MEKNNHTIKEQIDRTLNNLVYQEQAYQDDIDTMENILRLLQLGKSINDEYQITSNQKQKEVFLNKLNSIK